MRNAAQAYKDAMEKGDASAAQAAQSASQDAQ